MIRKNDNFENACSFVHRFLIVTMVTSRDCFNWFPKWSEGCIVRRVCLIYIESTGASKLYFDKTDKSCHDRCE